MRIKIGECPPRFRRTTGMLAAVSAAAVVFSALAEEAKEAVKTAISTTTLSGYVSTSAVFRPAPTTSGPQPPGVTLLGFTNGQVQLSLTVTLDRTNRLEVSKNLVTWEPAATFLVATVPGGTATAAEVLMNHTNASLYLQHYYRLVELPTVP